MNFLEFIFFLISKLVNSGIDSERKEQLKTDAFSWYESITSKDTFAYKFKQVNEFWGVRLTLSCVALPLLSFVRNFSFRNAEELPKQGLKYPDHQEYTKMMQMMQMMEMMGGTGYQGEQEIPDGYELV